MEVALRQRLEGVAGVAISEGEQTTEVIFAPGDHAFSLEAFRTALQQADVEVLTIEADACGVVEAGGSSGLLRAGKVTLLLTGAEAAASGSGVCVTGRLDTKGGRLRLAVDRLEPAPGLELGS